MDLDLETMAVEKRDTLQSNSQLVKLNDSGLKQLRQAGKKLKNLEESVKFLGQKKEEVDMEMAFLKRQKSTVTASERDHLRKQITQLTNKIMEQVRCKWIFIMK